MIEIVGKKYVTPFSKGILAGSLMKAGLDVDKAYQMTEDIRKKMEASSITSITEEDLITLTHQTLQDAGYTHVASYYEMWHSLREKKPSIIILLGGATGIGKSTIASEISYRLGIHSIIGTDMVREVMRKMVSRELLPTLHTSSFQAWKEVQVPSSYLSPVIYAFDLQVSHVAVGINALIQRALTEGISLVIEGIHLVPGPIFSRDDAIFYFVLTLQNEEEHVNRLYARAQDTKRTQDQYVAEFDKVRQIQDHIVGQAHKYEVVVLENKMLEETVSQIMDTIYRRLQKRAKK